MFKISGHWMVFVILSGAFWANLHANPEDLVAEQTLREVRNEEQKRRAEYKGDPELFEPEPVMLARFQLDVTGDDVPEIFVGASLSRQPAVKWSVFSGSDSRLVASGLELDPRQLYTQKGSNGIRISQVTRFSDNSYGLRSYEFGALGQAADLSRPLSEKERAALRFEPEARSSVLGSITVPRAEVILLEQYAADPGAPWRPWDRERSSFAQVTGDDLQYLKALRDGTYTPVKPSHPLPQTDGPAHTGVIFSKPDKKNTPATRLDSGESSLSSASGRLLIVVLLLFIGFGFYVWARYFKKTGAPG